MMTRVAVRLVPLAALAIVASAGRAGAQTPGGPSGPCALEFENTPNSRLTISRLPSGKSNTFLGGGVVAHCANQPITLRSDSAEYYGERDVLYLVGSVHYQEPRATVDSRRMTYFHLEERLLAEGDVVAVLPSGTSMKGPQATYYRPTAGRPQARLYATGRPHMSLVQRDSSGRAQEPVGLVADRVFMDADSLVYAGGKVEITRSDIDARGDSAFLDSGKEFARLMRSPSIVGKQQRTFRLSGERIDLWSRQRQLERVLSVANARASSEDMTLTSDTLDMRVADNRLQRAVAWGKGRARVVSASNDIIADSLDVVMPGQQLREVHALRNAYAQSVPDTTKIRTSERDWLRGDTIIARFDSLPAADTSKRPKVREVVATGAARSFYHMASRTGDASRPAINYVRGREITVAFRDQAVSTVTVLDKAVGMYLEPSDSTKTALPAAGATPAGRGRGTTTAPARPTTRRPAGLPTRIPGTRP
jgi:lipopolysaccharide export system protein LptA